jgi:hypothetical protein
MREIGEGTVRLLMQILKDPSVAPRAGDAAAHFDHPVQYGAGVDPPLTTR